MVFVPALASIDDKVSSVSDDTKIKKEPDKIGRTSIGSNTIAACVHGTQTVSDGQALRLRLTEPMSVAGRFIPKGTVLVGGTRIQGERLEIMVNAVEYKRTILPVELEVYDLDGQQGILVPGSLEYDAAREIAANMGTSMNSSINISTDAGAQIASDLGKGVIQGVSMKPTMAFPCAVRPNRSLPDVSV